MNTPQLPEGWELSDPTPMMHGQWYATFYHLRKTSLVLIQDTDGKWMMQNKDMTFPSAGVAISYSIMAALGSDAILHPVDCTIPMTKADLIKRLGELRDDGDVEANHEEADRLLLGFINDPDITAAFDDVRKWYA